MALKKYGITGAKGVTITPGQLPKVAVQPGRAIQATLNSNGLVDQNPASATITPGPLSIPLSGGGGNIADGWISSTFVQQSQLATMLIWTKYTVPYTAFSTAGLTNSITLLSLPAKGVIHAVHLNATQAFTGGLIATYTLSVGIGGLLAKYLTALSVFTTGLQVPQGIIGVESMSGATNILITAVSTVGNLNTATQGSADLYALISTLP